MSPNAEVEALQRIIENMATHHVVFNGGGLHPDWCPLCRLEKAEQIGSPIAIAQWVEEVVIPELSLGRIGDVRRVCTAGDLLEAIRRSEVLL